MFSTFPVENRLLFPSEGLLLQIAQIDDPVNDSGGKLFKGFGLAVEGRACRTNDSTRFGNCFHVVDVNQAQWRIAWNQDQFSPFLQHHIGCACDQVI